MIEPLRHRQSSRILGFDGLRGFAVILVLSTHLQILRYCVDQQLLPQNVIGLFQGYVGVQIFFVLSGFLITMLLIKEFDTAQKISFKNFYIRRTLRIFPIYFLSLFLITIFNACHLLKVSTGSLAMAYTYLYNFAPITGLSIFIDYAWSLAVEEHFYLIWPSILSVFLKMDRGLILLSLGLMFVGSFVLYHFLSGSSWVNTHFYFLGRWTVFSGSDILIGCFFAMLLTGCNKNNYWVRVFENRSILLLGTVLYTNCLLLHSMPALAKYIRSMGIGVVVGWVYINQSSRLVKILEFAPLKFIGLISYGIYIWQGFLLTPVSERAVGQHWPPSPLVGLLLLIIVAPFSYYFIEKPFLQFKSRFS